jgi:hypothetical protein
MRRQYSTVGNGKTTRRKLIVIVALRTFENLAISSGMGGSMRIEGGLGEFLSPLSELVGGNCKIKNDGRKYLLVFMFY